MSSFLPRLARIALSILLAVAIPAAALAAGFTVTMGRDFSAQHTDRTVPAHARGERGVKTVCPSFTEGLGGLARW